MTALRVLLARLRALFTKRRDERDLDREIAGHLDASTDEYLSRGLSFALRQLGRNPGFAATAATMLAFGIGANVAVFAIVESMLLRPLPYAAPERLVDIDDLYQGRTSGVGQEEYREWKRDATLFDSFALVEHSALVIPGDDETDAERLEGNRVTAGFFRVLGARPLHGRTFFPDEDQPGKASVIVLSHTLWQRRFGGDPAVVGRSIRLGETSYTVIGVMPIASPIAG